MIGHVMRDCLRALRTRDWCETCTVAHASGMRCDWRNGAARKALHSLERRGLVESRRVCDGAHASGWMGYYEWRITDAGRKWLAENDRPKVQP